MIRTRNYLLVIFWIAIIVSLAAQNGVPQVISVDQLAINGSDVYCFIIINDSAFLRIRYPNQVAKINLITKQTEWSISMSTSFSVNDQLVKTPDNSICYADGGQIVKLSAQGDTLWVHDLSAYGYFSLSASSPDFLTCYSTSSHLVLLDYISGQMIDHWSIITGGVTSCGYHNAYASIGSTFYLFDDMPMGVLYTTGVKLTKVKIINGIAETIWFSQVDDLTDIHGIGLVNNNIYFTARQIDPWTNSLVYRIVDQGIDYTTESITDIAGPDSVGVVGKAIKITNNQLILPVSIRLGDDPNGEDGYSGAIMCYDNQDNLVWRINQTTMPFCLPLAVAIDSNKIYSVAMCSQTPYGTRLFYLTELSTTVSNDDPTAPIPDPGLTCYPNPFRSSTNVKFTQIDNSPTTIAIYNVKGQLVRTLIAGQKLPLGEQIIAWDGKTNAGQIVAAGIYYYKIHSGRFSSTKKIVLIK
jgi:hypothetical protein